MSKFREYLEATKSKIESSIEMKNNLKKKFTFNELSKKWKIENLTKEEWKFLNKNFKNSIELKIPNTLTGIPSPVVMIKKFNPDKI